MSMLNIRQIPAMTGFKIVPALVAALALAGCGASSTPETTALNAQAPIALTPKQDASGAPGALAGKVNEPELRKAVERYNLAKQRTPGPYDFAGVDLNGDGKSEAVVTVLRSRLVPEDRLFARGVPGGAGRLPAGFAHHQRPAAGADRT